MINNSYEISSTSSSPISSSNSPISNIQNSTSLYQQADNYYSNYYYNLSLANSTYKPESQSGANKYFASPVIENYNYDHKASNNSYSYYDKESKLESFNFNYNLPAYPSHNSHLYNCSNARQSNFEKSPITFNGLNSGESHITMVPSKHIQHVSGKTGSVVNRRRNRTQFSNSQIESLEAVFEKTHYPEVQLVDRLSEKLNLSIERISIWFQNRRAKHKKSKKSVSNDSRK